MHQFCDIRPPNSARGFILGIILVLLALMALYALTVAKMNWMVEKSQAQYIAKTKHFYRIESAITSLVLSLNRERPQPVGIKEEARPEMVYKIVDLGIQPGCCVCKGQQRFASHHYEIIATDEVFQPSLIVIRWIDASPYPCQSKKAPCVRTGQSSWSLRHDMDAL